MKMVDHHLHHPRTFFFLLFYIALVDHTRINVEGGNNYIDALKKSILFFQGQRSGQLPAGKQFFTWRGNSSLDDGGEEKVDLVGGYYDAGDNVKFNFPMAFTTTMLSWSVIEYAKRLSDHGQLSSSMAAIRWGTDYLLKCADQVQESGKLYIGVGDPQIDHQCWERPEDMDTNRTVYYVSEKNPGSDVAGETAAALAAASIVFRKVDPKYSRRLLESAKNVMTFAKEHTGMYTDSGELSQSLGSFYKSSDYRDELEWAGSWLYMATKNSNYVNLTAPSWLDESYIFGWDNKHSGVCVLLSKAYLVSKDAKFEVFNQLAKSYMCKILPDSLSRTVSYTPGLMFMEEWSNLQYVTSASFLLSTYAKYMAKAGHSFLCGNVQNITARYLRDRAQTQVDYILGFNPNKTSYMVGYGKTYPKKIHHRGSSIPSNRTRPLRCKEGFKYLESTSDNPNTLTGAIVGGPDSNDQFFDNRTDYKHSEPATYINAPMVGTLAYFAGRKK